MATTVATMMMMMKGNNTIKPTTSSSATDTEPHQPNPAVFHDFLGRKAAPFNGGSASPAAAPSASGAATSDLASERQVGGSRFERISCYGPNNDLSANEMSNRFVGFKRSNSDSAFMSASREGYPHMIPENSHVMKMLRSASGGERQRVFQYEGPFHGAHQMRPGSASFMLQPTTSNTGNLAKSERPIPMNVGGSSLQYSTCIGQAPSPLGCQVPLSRSRDGSTTGPSVLSQLAADEGSRTGNKGSGLSNSINASNLIPERNPSALLPSGCKTKSVIPNSDLESSNPPSRHGIISYSRQMTIIYGGQVHVFDDVHPNKADVIMALAGSSGGSWCTTLPKSSAKTTTSDSYLPLRDNETSIAGDSSLPQKYHKILTSVARNSIHGLSSTSQGGIITKDAGTQRQAVESSLEAKQEV